MSAVALAVLGAAPSSAQAGRFDDHRGYGDHGYGDRDGWRHDDHDHGHVDFRIGGGPVIVAPPPAPVVVVPNQVWVAPVYQTVVTQQWCEPVYRTVVDHVWIAPVTRTDVERTWVADRYEWRNVDHVDGRGKHFNSREYVLCEPAHWADVPHEVVITPGHYEDHPRQELVTAGHYENVETQQLVTPGHYETCATPAVVVDRPPYHDDGVHVSIGARFPL